MESNRALVITLGHNSSVIFASDGIVIGYEEERLNKIKSTSLFPILSLELIESKVDISNSILLISHWYDEFDLSKVNKPNQVDYAIIIKYIHKYNLNYIPLSENFAHHESHAYSSLAFLQYFATTEKVRRLKSEDMFFLVLDGFGNKGNTLSIYRAKTKDIQTNLRPFLECIFKSYGYATSLGLMYQFATIFCGMKAHQDEYKFLGYEYYIKSVLSESELLLINNYVSKVSEDVWQKILANTSPSTFTADFINIPDFENAKNEWYLIFYNTLAACSIVDVTSFEARVVIGYTVQCVLEFIVKNIISFFNITNICTSGGVFYNVKLNNVVLNSIKGYLSVMPLAGDSGAGIGLIQYHTNVRIEFNNLNFGKRFLNVSAILKLCNYNNVTVVDRKNIFSKIDFIVETLLNNGLVNLINGDMEFGPRALCNTTTLCLPNKSNSEKINKLNDRNDVMPFAPVILKRNLTFFFKPKEYKRIIGSDKFMVITYRYNDHVDIETYGGVMHKHPLYNYYTGRPQVINKDEFHDMIYLILNAVEKRAGIKCLINTSFNVHGSPIVYSDNDIAENFNFQCKRALAENISLPHLIIITE